MNNIKALRAEIDAQFKMIGEANKRMNELEDKLAALSKPVPSETHMGWVIMRLQEGRHVICSWIIYDSRAKAEKRISSDEFAVEITWELPAEGEE